MAIGIVLAGRRNKGALARVSPATPWEALIPIGGRPMAGHVVAALEAVHDVRRVIVAGPQELAADGCSVVPPGDRITASLRAALDALEAPPDPAEELLVAAGDAPLLTPDAVAGLLEQARHRRLGVAYPIVPRSACEARFPGMRRTYVRLREGAFTGGNCFYLRGAALPSTLALLERLYADRKRPLRLARMLGWGLVGGIVLGTARIRDAESAATRLLGCVAGAVVARDPGIGVDVDRPEDLRLCRAILEGQR